MAYFAELNSDNKVINIIVADTKEVLEEVFPDSIFIEYTQDNPASTEKMWNGTEFVKLEEPTE